MNQRGCAFQNLVGLKFRAGFLPLSASSTVPIRFSAAANRQSRPEKSDAQVRAVNRLKQRTDPADPAKHGAHSEDIDVRPSC
jgi:hypothetical protein